MNLVLYSGGQTRLNQRLHRRLVEMACSQHDRTPEQLKMAYLPFCHDGADLFFERFKKRYSKFGITRFSTLACDEPFTHKNLKSILRSDVIYLAGGNTFYFLKHLRKAGLISELKVFAERGGILAGLSAGAILLTPNITLAAVPEFDADPNDVQLKVWKSLGLTDFEFSPHYSRSTRRDERLIQYSRKTPNPVYASHDGGGIVVENGKIDFIGENVLFHRGKKLKI